MVNACGGEEAFLASYNQDRSGFFGSKAKPQKPPDRPMLLDRQVYVINAFRSLDRDRRVDQGTPLHIREAEVHEYIKNNSSHGYYSDVFVRLILAIDKDHIERVYAEIKRKIEQSRKK